MYFKKQNGITLISLMVTIVVLIILAIVLIGMLTGDNGVIKRVENAKNETISAGKLENNTLDSYSNLIDDYANFNVIGSTETHTHNFSSKTETEKYIKSEATCTEAAVYYYSCSICAKKGTETYLSTTSIAKGHNYESEITKEPTCIEIGIQTYTCSICGDIKTETIEKLSYLVDEVEIGDYIELGNTLNYTNQLEFSSGYTTNNTALTGWRVLSKSGSGADGEVTLVSAGTPLSFYHPSTGISDSSLQYLSDLNKKITLVNVGTQGIIGNGFNTTDLASVWSSNSNINTSAGIHALTTGEVETAYAEITKVSKTISELNSMTNALQTSYMKTVAENAGGTMSQKSYDLLGIGIYYWLAGSKSDNYGLWFVYDKGTVSAASGFTDGVRIVVTLNSGSAISHTNTGDGSSLEKAYILSK